MEEKKIVIVLRCPFCDSLDIVQGSYMTTYYVKCNACLAIGPKATSQQVALGKWNKRVANAGTNKYGSYS